MRLNIQSKLGVMLLVIGLPTLIIMGVLGYVNGNRAILKLAEDNLVSVNAGKGQHLVSYMANLELNVETLGFDPTIVSAVKEFASTADSLPEAKDPGALWEFYRRSYPAEEGQVVPEPPETASARRLQELYVSENPYPIQQHQRLLDAGDGSPYSAVHRRFHPFLSRVRDSFGLYNLMIVDASTRRIVYGVIKQADFQVTLDSKTLEGSNLKVAAEAALAGKTSVVDFKRFAPAFNAPVAYVASPILEEGKVVGAVVAQLKIEEITRILTGGGNYAAEGLGETGDVYIVGEDGTMRSDSRRLKDDLDGLLKDLTAKNISTESVRFVRDKKTTVLAFPVLTDATKAIFQGSSGFGRMQGYDGAEVFAAYEPLNISGLKWGIVSRRGVAETLSPLSSFRRSALLAAVGVLIAIGIAASLLAESFVKPIRSMGEAARRFGQGNRGIRIEEASRDDELGELGREFNAMIEDSERAERIQNQIRRNIVHDLKTPVTVIKGMGETLMYPEMAEDPTWRDEMVKAIVEQSDRLLDDLKDILMPIDENYRPEPEEFDMAILVERVVRSERHTSRAKEHEIIVTGTDAPFEVTADRRKLRRVIENVLSNAIKYSPDQGNKIWIDLKAADNNRVEVSVRDEGLGMDPDQLAKVLREGGRVEEHTSLGIEGTGFGLDSVQKILRAHGGELRAISQKGKGSTFTVSLPVRVVVPVS